MPTTAWAAPTASGGCATSSSGTCWAASQPAGSGPASRDHRTRLAAGVGPAERRRRPEHASVERRRLDLADLGSDRSELRGAIERYEVDRGSLLRSLPPSGSPQRDERLREFTTQWLDQLGKLDFDRLEPGRQGRLPALQEPPGPRAASARHPARRARRVGAAGPVRPTDPRPRRGAARAQADGLVEGRRRPEPAGQGDRRRARDARGSASRDRAKDAVEERGPPTAPWRRSRACGTRSAAGIGFYDGYDPLFTWWMQEPYKAADQALQAYAGFLRQRFGAVGDRARAATSAPAAVAGGAAGRRRRRRCRRRAVGGGAGARRPPDRATTPRPPRARRARSSATRSAARRSAQRAQVRDDLVHARRADRPRPQGAGLVRGRDEEGRARDGPGRRLAGGARARQDDARRAGQAAGPDPRPGRSRRSSTSTPTTW